MKWQFAAWIFHPPFPRGWDFFPPFISFEYFPFPQCGWSLTQSLNIKKGSFSCFLQSVRFWRAHLICFPWANPCFSHSGTLRCSPLRSHFQVVMRHCRRYCGENGGERSEEKVQTETEPSSITRLVLYPSLEGDACSGRQTTLSS